MGPELMAYGFSSGESYLSDLTLAFVEDRGQLIANYSAAGSAGVYIISTTTVLIHVYALCRAHYGTIHQ
jgi:hypothetical protein